MPIEWAVGMEVIVVTVKAKQRIEKITKILRTYVELEDGSQWKINGYGRHSPAHHHSHIVPLQDCPPRTREAYDGTADAMWKMGKPWAQYVLQDPSQAARVALLALGQEKALEFVEAILVLIKREVDWMPTSEHIYPPCSRCQGVTILHGLGSPASSGAAYVRDVFVCRDCGNKDWPKTCKECSGTSYELNTSAPNRRACRACGGTGYKEGTD